MCASSIIDTNIKNIKTSIHTADIRFGSQVRLSSYIDQINSALLDECLLSLDNQLLLSTLPVSEWENRYTQIKIEIIEIGIPKTIENIRGLFLKILEDVGLILGFPSQNIITINMNHAIRFFKNISESGYRRIINTQLIFLKIAEYGFDCLEFNEIAKIGLKLIENFDIFFKMMS